MTDRAHVERLLGVPELSRLVDQLHRRRSAGRPLTGSIVLSGSDAGERAAVAALFGRRAGSGTTVTVDLDRLDGIVAASGAAATLADGVEALRGPAVPRGEAAERERRAWQEVFAVLDPFIARRTEFADWADRGIATGVIKRQTGTPADAQRILIRVAAVLDALPVQAESLQRFAARILGSAHALDPDTVESALVLSALRSTGGGDGSGTGTAEERRRVWGEAGIALDSVSSTVLVHRLALPGALGELTRAGEPVVVTLRQLQGLDIPPPTEPVMVCENPSVVEAAALELGATSRPLVCVGGQPSLATHALLRAIAPAGLRYHGDFDWGGIRIGNGLHRRYGFTPWRYGAADLARVPHAGGPLRGTPADADWDAALRPALERRGTALEEEHVLDALLDDLAG